MIGFKIVKIIIKMNTSSEILKDMKAENKGLEQYIPGKFQTRENQSIDTHRMQTTVF